MKNELNITSQNYTNKTNLCRLSSEIQFTIISIHSLHWHKSCKYLGHLTWRANVCYMLPVYLLFDESMLYSPISSLILEGSKCFPKNFLPAIQKCSHFWMRKRAEWLKEWKKISNSEELNQIHLWERGLEKYMSNNSQWWKEKPADLLIRRRGVRSNPS